MGGGVAHESDMTGDTGDTGDTEFPAVTPDNMEGEFPSPVLTEFNPIEKAPYKFVNARKFAKRFARFNRRQILKNYALAQRLAFRELDTELAGLTKYAPAAAALKRQQTSADNAFNQAQRMQQINAVMPEAKQQLLDQGKQAAELAKGKLPDFLSEAEDRALELGIRSRSADNSMAGGFGASSSVSKKASDLMSADARYQMGVQRYQLGMQQTQYGNQLLGQNIQEKAGLYLAPTEYSNAGQELRVSPEIGGSRLAAGAMTEINQLTAIPTELAFRSKIQQNQFDTQLEQQTRMFNATGLFDMSKANAGIQNQFALDKFGYQVGYAGVQAGVETANNNTALGLDQQAQAAQIFQDYAQQAQQSQQAGAISQGAGVISGAANLVNGIAGLFSPSSGNTTPPVGGGDYTGPGSPSYNYGGDEGGGISGSDVSWPTVDENGWPTTESSPDISGDGGGDTGYNGPGSPNYSYGEDYTRSAKGSQFEAASGVPFRANYQGASDSTLRLAGITKDPSAIPGAVKMGADYNGQTVYSNPALLGASDSTAGRTLALTLAQLVAPFGALDGEQLGKLEGISQVAADPQIMSELDGYASNKDAKGFIDAALKPWNSDSKTSPDAAATAYTAFQAMQNWQQMSPEQKSLLTAGFGLKATDLGNGKNLGAITIPSTNKPGAVPISVSQALKWMSQGINSYPLVKKWDQYTTLAKVIAGKNSPDAVANIANQFKLLGAGVNGAEVPGITAEGLSKAGWAPALHLGVGAISGRSGSIIPNGYVRVAESGGQTIAAPKGTAYTAQGAVLRSAPAGKASGPFNFANGNQTAQQVQDILNWGAGAYNIYSMWHGQKPSIGAAIGTAGTIANAVDRYNASQHTPSNYGQGVGAAAQAYSAYQAAKKGNYVGAAGYGTAAAFNGMAAWARANGNKALAAQYSQYAGYAQAGLNMYGAYNAYQHGDKPGAAMLGAGAGFELAGYGGAGLIGSGAYTSYHAFGTGNVAQGALGGSMMMAGTAMMMGGPVGWAVGGGLLAASVLGSAIKTGTTNKAHIERNTFRTYLKENTGLIDEDSNLTLADGSTWSIGQENDQGRHAVAHPELLTEEDKGRANGNSLRAYDCDYTNDLDFTSTMIGTSLNRLLAGSSGTTVDQIGTEIGNAAISNIGYGQDMTRDNFNKMIANQRSFFSKAGIGSKTDAYQLANAAFSEGRMNELEHTQTLISIDMIFDENGYDRAQQLMSGRQNGVAAAQSAAKDTGRPSETEVHMEEAPKPAKAPPQTNVDWSKQPGMAVDPGFVAANFVPYGGGTPTLIPRSASRMSKEDIRALNASRYQAA